MEVRPGYKHTEVGVIPEDWGVESLGALAAIERGKFSARPRNDPKYYGGETPFLQTGDVTRSGGKIATFSQTLNAEGVNVSRLFPSGTLFFTIAANIGDVGIAEFAAACPDSLVAISPKSQTEKLWLLYELSRRKQDFETLASPGAQLNINLEKLRPYLLPVPTLAEQRAIVAALTDMDALLSGLDRLIAKKRDLQQAATQQLLTGKTHLPGFSPSKPHFKQSDVGRIPEHWGLARLVDLVDPSRSIRYGIVQPGNYDPHGRFMVRGQDYSEVKGWAAPTDVFRVSSAIEERYRNARVKTGDLIMTIVGYCGHVEIIPAWLDGANLPQTTARIAIHPSKAVSAYCKYVLSSPTGKNQVASYIKGAAQPGLNCGDVEKFLLPIPPLPEQSAIAEVLSDMDAELAALRTRRDKTRNLKQAMMQELLTGKTRLLSTGGCDA